MTDPYKVLGVSKDATEDEINAAYRKLVKQYHPDKYVGNPLSDLAAEKIKEINAAYDAVMNEKRGNSSKSTSNNGSYIEIRQLINMGKISEAEAKLNSVSVRDAEWHFLMGIIMKRKGWYDMAYQHLQRATDLDPSNAEYRAAKDGLDFSGYGYRQMGTNTTGTDCCSMCQGLICADCCCEMCGGNLIPCIGCR